MVGDLVSKRSRNLFREYLVGWTLGTIELEFEAAEIQCDRNHQPSVSGMRRALVEQYYSTLDFTDPEDVLKLLEVYEGVLTKSYAEVSDATDALARSRYLDELVESLYKDGYAYADGRISPATPHLRQFLRGHMLHSVSEATRRTIWDSLVIDDVNWSGRLTEPEFLSRLYKLEDMPSFDGRFETAEGDIYQHRVNNPDDWQDDWILTDSRFDLLNASDEDFLSFLCETIHPAVRPDQNEVQRLLANFNQYLKQDGWEISARTQLSGRPVFAPRRRLIADNPALNAIKPAMQVLNAEYITTQIARMEGSIETDPELAIGTAKEFIETICKTILAEVGKPVTDKPDLPKLVKMTREELALIPDAIPDSAKGADVVKRLLSNLATIAQGMAELRSLYGSGHGKEGRTKGIQSRHARLAVGASCTLGLFLFETFQERQAGKK